MKDLSGVFTALITPFQNGAVDFHSLKKIIRYQLDNGINGFVVSGTTAESPCLSPQEREKIFQCVLTEVGGKVPVIVGTGSNNTEEAVLLTQEAEKWGADAALVVVPYYNKPPQRGLIAHFKKIAGQTQLPILLYNVPSRTISKLELESVVELSRVANIVGIKEASGDFEFDKKIIASCPQNFIVSSGDDASYLPLTLAGGKGIISVGSHILPKEFVRFFQRARKGDQSVMNEFQHYLDVINGLYIEANPIPVKMALYLMGQISSPELRLPLMALPEPQTAELKKKMSHAGIL